MEFGIFSFNEFIYTDTSLLNSKKEINIIAPRNSFLCSQILIKNTNELKVIFNSDFIAPEIYQMLPVYVGRNHGTGSEMVIEQGTPCDYSARVAPFNVYDALKPIHSNIISPDKFSNIALYLRWPTKDCNAGNYTGKFYLNDQEVTVNLSIADVAVPEKETLRVTNWFGLGTMAKAHNVSPWSEEHWEMIEKYGKIMRSCRQTDFWTSSSYDYKKCENGEYIFDFSKLKRLINLYFSLGFTHIEGMPIMNRNGWADNNFYVRINGESVLALSDEGQKFLKCYYTQFYKFICENGLQEVTQHHICDEPHSGCAEDYVKLSKIIKKYIPGIKIVEAVETTDVYGAVDTWVTTIKGYEENGNKHEEFKKNGVDFWFYTCCYPGGKYLNRFLDNELIRTRYLHWANFLYGYKGYLHWGLNIYYSNPGDPYSFACDIKDKYLKNILPPGDTHIVYPDGKNVYSSARLEMMRAGIEDYELIKMLADKDKFAADELVNKCVRSFTEYSTDVNHFDEVYKELLSLL